eukprot:9837818-Alexandrium_andersonii.AAC.1
MISWQSSTRATCSSRALSNCEEEVIGRACRAEAASRPIGPEGPGRTWRALRGPSRGTAAALA